MTAKDFIKPGYDQETAMIAFAKYCVEEAVQEIIKKATIKTIHVGRDWGFTEKEIYKTLIDKEAIINAYPLTNIK